VFKAAKRLHTSVQTILPGVSERRVAEVVREADCLCELLIQPQLHGYRAADLRHFERMCQTSAVMIAFVIDEHLGLVYQTPERRRMNDPVAVSLKLTPIRMRRLRMNSAPAVAFPGGVALQTTHSFVALCAQ
jgi:hypothetical protein